MGFELSRAEGAKSLVPRELKVGKNNHLGTLGRKVTCEINSY